MPNPVVELEPAPLPRPTGVEQWHLIHTRSRQEKAIARALEAADIRYELPLRERVSYRRGRKFRVTEPLFTSYLFLFGPREATFFATATKRVASVIAVPEQDRFVRDLEQVKVAVAGGADLRPWHYLEVGRRVRVTAGPFEGLEGVVEMRTHVDRLVLQIDALGRATSLEIDADLLEPA